MSHRTSRPGVLIADFQTSVRSPDLFSRVVSTLSIAMAARTGVSMELWAASNRYVCAGKSSEEMRTVIGTIAARVPKVPSIPVDRSCVTEPITAPVSENLKDR